MKMIKLSDDHYVVVDDSKIQTGDWVVGCTRTVVQCMYPENVHHRDVKKITHSTNIDWHEVYYIPLSEVKELLGEVDVEEKAKDYLFYDYQREWNVPTNDEQYGVVTGYIKGYNQALEDNKDRKYTREDLLDAYTWGFLEGTERGDDVTDSVNKFSQSLQPKTEWDVEFVNGKLKLV